MEKRLIKIVSLPLEVTSYLQKRSGLAKEVLISEKAMLIGSAEYDDLPQ